LKSVDTNQYTTQKLISSFTFLSEAKGSTWQIGKMGYYKDALLGYLYFIG